MRICDLWVCSDLGWRRVYTGSEEQLRQLAARQYPDDFICDIVVFYGSYSEEKR